MIGLKIQRIKKSLTQEELAIATGISLRQIRAYEQGTRNPKKDAQIKLAKFLGCKIEELYEA